MKFSENWLRSLVDIPVDRDALVHRLTMSGLEVEGVEPIGAALDGIVVAEILSCEPHPNADKLRVCKVAAGKDTLQIVCGAPNARAGLKAPLATIGAKLPNGVEIKQAALRGVDSQGMLCSAKELGIDADASGLMELAGDAPVGEALAKYLGLPDASIELKLTPNRPDCLSVHGLARDVAALFASTFHAPAIEGSGRRHRIATRDSSGIRRRLPALSRPRDRRHRSRREDAALDRRAAAPFGTATDQRGRRRDQLRHARARPAAARIRQREGIRRNRRSPRARRRKAQAARRQRTCAQAEIPRHRRRRKSARARRRHGRLRLARDRFDARRLPRKRALRSARHHGSLARARIAQRRRTSFRARRRSRITEARDRACDGSCSSRSRAATPVPSSKRFVQTIFRAAILSRCAGHASRACSISSSKTPTSSASCARSA